MATFQCEIVSAEESLFSGAITSLSVRGTIGELGITPGHAPLLTGINPGAVTLQMEDGNEQVYFASGGYLEVQPGFVTLLADTALRAEDLDEAQAEEARILAEKSHGRSQLRNRILVSSCHDGRGSGQTAHPRRASPPPPLNSSGGAVTPIDFQGVYWLTAIPLRWTSYPIGIQVTIHDSARHCPSCRERQPDEI